MAGANSQLCKGSASTKASVTIGRGPKQHLDDAVAAALDRQLDDNDAWLPTRRHSDTAVAYTASAAKVTRRPSAAALYRRARHALSVHTCADIARSRCAGGVA